MSEVGTPLDNGEEFTPEHEQVAQELNLPIDHPAVEALVYSRSGERQAIRLLSEAISELSEARSQLEKYRRDSMTGLLLRGPFIEEADTLRNTVYKNFVNGYEGHDLALMLMLDLKRLRKINRKGGLPAGDKAIANVGRRLGNLTQADEAEIGSIAGRIGGDEFAILLTFDTSKLSYDGALDIIHSRLHSIEMDTPKGIRVGDAAISHPSKEVIDLFREADPKIPKSRKQKIGKFTLDLWHSSMRKITPAKG